MGYCSEVAIKCEEKAYELFKQVFTETNFHIAPDKIYKDGTDYIIYWDWIKWYEDYNDVATITHIMNELDTYGNDDGGYGYIFLRLGEGDSDIEKRSNDENIELWIIRKIDIPDGLEEVKHNETAIFEKMEDTVGLKKEKSENEECFVSNGAPYPLCKGGKGDKCHECCLYENYEEYNSPFPY